MTGPMLSPEQAAVLGPDARIVEAGPGSGKTRALVARFIDRASTSKRGVAFLSFTNAAIDEASKRCAGQPHLLRAPHFVGTIDSFLHRFIVTPSEVKRIRRTPTYLPSWDDLPESLRMARLQSVPGHGIRLSAFSVDAQGMLQLNRGGLRWEEEGWLTQVQKAHKEQALTNVVTARIAGLNSRGVFDASSARIRAFHLLSGDDGDTILDRLARRFGEVLVDEAQDCDAAEFGTLRLLRAKGIEVLVVADPDQAIFEFRGGDPDLFFVYRNEQPAASAVELTTNWRSTGEICRAVSALRAAGTAAITPHEDTVCCPVYLLSGSPQEQGGKFRLLLDEFAIDPADAVVIAHRLSDARSVTGGGPAADGSNAGGNRLADACAQLGPGRGDTSTRLRAVNNVEHLILSMIDWPEDLLSRGLDAKLEAIDRSRRWLRQAAGALVSGLQNSETSDAFGTRARALMSGVLHGLSLPALALGPRLKKPTDAVWARCQAGDEIGPTGVTTNTIHGVKGCEFGAVLVALPDSLRKVDGKTVLDNIDDGVNTEPRRVLYVGASRASKLLVFGAGVHTTRVAELLTERDVTVEVR